MYHNSVRDTIFAILQHETHIFIGYCVPQKFESEKNPDTLLSKTYFAHFDNGHDSVWLAMFTLSSVYADSTPIFGRKDSCAPITFNCKLFTLQYYIF